MTTKPFYPAKPAPAPTPKRGMAEMARMMNQRVARPAGAKAKTSGKGR